MDSPLFEHIFLDREVRDLRVVEQVRRSFPNQEIKLIGDRSEMESHIDRSSSKSRINSGKKILYLNNYKGEVVKYCPARSTGSYLCCNLHTINLMSNCIYNCVYCILQACLTNPVMQVHCNLDEIFSGLQEFDHQATLGTRICTGEISDSLALEPWLHQALYLVEFFSGTQNLFLELKTKSNHVDHLLDLDHRGRTIVSFSLNPEPIVRSVELHTASLDQRLEAARKLLDKNYRVAFNLDPILYYEGWNQDYLELMDRIESEFKGSEIAWVHIGLLRFISDLDGLARQRFPGSTVFDQEFIQGPDKKYRYPRPIRDELYDFILTRLRNWDSRLPVYTCVEKASHWNRHYEEVPTRREDVNSRIMARV
jgi:spore photoproduct lyase